MATSTPASEPDWDITSSSPKALDPNAITTGSLKALHGNDQRKVMDIVDKLRRAGLSGVVELPQLAVCGDQSSGKSSVLEAITEIPFPRKENLCTRFATEIILRRSPTSSISITITPDKLRPPIEQESLRAFSKTIEDFKQLPDVIDDATQVMGLGRVGEINSKAFSRDVLSVEICGPDRPQLTLIDLPGLTHATNKTQTAADKELVLDLVMGYMKNPRTIILAVISAKNDFNNQIILEHVRKIDGASSRTLGIVTKPDYLREGSENESSWLDLVQNKDVYLERGWHMLKNRAEDEMQCSFAERNESETTFFSKGNYADLPREHVGVDSLRQRLSRLLLGHLIKELPSLKEEMNSKLQDTVDAIEKLGEKRSTITEQRMMLMKISMQINDIMKSAVKGYYDQNFFGSVQMDAAVDSAENIRRFRAVVQFLNVGFADNMRIRGHKFAIGAGPGDDDDDAAEDERAQEELNDLDDDVDSVLLPKPKSLTRDEAVAWVRKVLERSRGLELPGNPNATLTSQLFWEQSDPWEKIAAEHVAKVARACKQFVYTVLQHSAPAEFQGRLAGLSVDAAIASALNAAKDELQKIIKDKRRQPMTYNHYFTNILQKQRQRKQQQIMQQARDASEELVVDQRGYERTRVVPERMEQALADSLEQDMDKYSSEEALDNQRAYYKDEMKYFVNAVAKQVIERHLVEPLPDIVLSPLVVAQLSDDEIQFVAAEPAEITQQRDFLENRMGMLEKGLDTFREAMGGLKR
ncbi:P-loop containing nucleoside triphosphate hydrolase protein [Lophiotrema nucula]|uniref:P-loop containing nucleoside triphosphate hydrolase protein n=1 Tax=Lophiotrema nucula TaxID=690887 RepID=A0A6A5ZDU7_9PLEO|nr:P-loop containing nucleoside triphosphate hydrolase protein [Lophiotrema nucula]